MRTYISILYTTFMFIQGICVAQGQEPAYRYKIDLTSVQNDQLKVELSTPQVKQKKISFFMPKIIPGTYSISDFGKFISEVKAFDKRGRPLEVKQISVNSWQISKANKMVSMSYIVDDITDSETEHNVYMMAASNFEENKNFVIQPSAFFGYFEGMKKLPFEVSITKPAHFYGSTGLTPVKISAQNDVYRTKDYDHLVDSPLMYNEPDTTFIKVGNTNVLISVYSPTKKVTSAYLAKQFEKMLQAQKKYLGDNLPVDKYAFILYFADPKTASPQQGALEHNQSSFFFLSEEPQEILAPLLVDFAAHEFFHIITPLTIHSREIADFNFNEPILSQHLWLYEGVTEYASIQMQVRDHLISPEEFLAKLADKIKNSQTAYIDTLPFTVLSKESAGKWANQYSNVYEKGALIAAMLDIRLIELSNGKMDLQDLILMLSNRYGKDNPFIDDELFAHIEALTYPEIGDFFRAYVAGNQRLPYQIFFDKVGINMIQEPFIKVATLGKIGLGYNQEMGMLEVNNIEEVNEFGKRIGYQKGDLLESLQGEDIIPSTSNEQLKAFNKNTNEGDQVTIQVQRKTENGTYEKVLLSAPAMLIDVPGAIRLEINPQTNTEQRKFRAVWLEENPSLFPPEDANSIEAVIKIFYDVISGQFERVGPF